MDSSFAIQGPLSSDGASTRYAAQGKLPNAIDLSHHLNSVATHRTPNALKELYQYAAVPGMIPMAGVYPPLLNVNELEADNRWYPSS
jgi:hypothetical protein